MKPKFFFTVLSLTLVLVMAITSIGLAASTNKKLSTNFTLVNLSTTEDAVVNVSYTRSDGSTWTADPNNTDFTISKNFGQRAVAQYFDETLSPGQGSVVISSPTPLGAVVQIQARNQVATLGAYVGVSSDIQASSFFIPIVLVRRMTGNGEANTQIIVQNMESDGPTSVTVNLIPSPESQFQPITKPSVQITENSTYYYDLEEDDSLPSGWFGSAVVTAADGRNIAVVVNIFAGNHALQTFNAFPETAVANNWSIPQFTSKLSNGLSTPVTFQNLSGASIQVDAVTLSCTSTISTPQEFTIKNPVAVPDGGSYVFNPVDDPNNLIPDNWSGACTLASPADVVTYVQMRRPGVSDEFAAYEAFSSDATDTFVVVPLVSKRQPNGFATSLAVQNVSTSSSANVTLTYIPSDEYVAGGGSNQPITINKTIPAGGNLLQNHRIPDDVPNMPDRWYGTLTIESTNGVPIVGYVQLTNYLGVPGDSLMAHQAFMMAPPTD